MRRKALLVVFLVFLATSVAADDKWPGTGSDDVVTEGTYTGEITAGDQQDGFRIRVQRGQYVEVSFTAKEGAKEPTLSVLLVKDPYELMDEYLEFRGVKGGETFSSAGVTEPNKIGKPVKFEAWARTDGYLVFSIDGKEDGVWEWNISIDRSDPDVSLMEVRNMEDRIVELQNKVDRKEERIQSLTSRLESKNQTISSLRQQVENLNGSSSVELDVTVSPASGSSFESDGGATVETSVQGGSLENERVQISYRGSSYSVEPGASRKIALEGQGQQSMEVNYADQTEEVSFKVASGNDDQSQNDNKQNSGGGDQSDSGGGLIESIIGFFANLF